VSAKVDSHEELVEDAENLSRSATPSTHVIPRCVYFSPADEPCGGVAATRCSSRACLQHCREIRAIENGVSPEEATLEGAKGGLVGMGCEAHESKEAARKERAVEKRKHKQVWKKIAKQRRDDAKNTGKAQDMPPMLA
jgi:hypothetical protein